MLLRNILTCYAELHRAFPDDPRVEMLGSAIAKADVAIEEATEAFRAAVRHDSMNCAPPWKRTALQLNELLTKGHL